MYACALPTADQALALRAWLLYLQNHDRRPAATALQHTWQQLQKRQQQHDQQQHLSSRLGGLYSSTEDQQQATAAAASGQQQQLISQAKLSQLLQQQLGYSLTVRPSNIQHQDAGRGGLLLCLCAQSSNSFQGDTWEVFEFGGKWEVCSTAATVLHMQAQLRRHSSSRSPPSQPVQCMR